MQRFLSAVVLVSVGAMLPARALAQTAPATAGAAALPTPSTAKPAPLKAAPARAPGAKPAANDTAPSKASPDDRLSDDAELSRVAGLYEAGKYRECSSEIERLLDPTGRAPLRTPGIVENARVYWAACLLGAGESEAADAPLRAAIHENPQMKAPDSLVFPQPVVEHFLKVRDSLVNEIRAAEQTRIRQAQAEARRRQELLARDRDRMRELEKLARQETIIYKNSRWLASLPFGIGQFQNRETGLGYTFLVSEAVFASLSFTAIVVQSRLATEADNLRKQGKAVDEVKQQNNQSTWSSAKTLSFWTFAAIAAGGILQAELGYVPEFRETRARPLPPSPALSPSPVPKPVDVSASPYLEPTGGGVSLMGRF